MKDILIDSIRSQIADYRREDGVVNINFLHVHRWISQFPNDEQMSILLGMNQLLNTYYLSKEDAKAKLRGFLKTKEIFGEKVLDGIINCEFIDIQVRGSSQKDLLDLADEVLSEEFDVTLDYCFSKETFVYLDDCIYSGNRMRYDLVPWIEEVAPENSHLIVYHMAYHTQGFRYAEKHVREAARRKGINVDFYHHLEIDTDRNGRIEFFWPKEKEYDEATEGYMQQVNRRAVNQGLPEISFRPSVLPLRESVFRTKGQRDRMEEAFLREGVRLVQGAYNPSESMRPLGFHKLTSLGFGSLFVTYRNIANNCPLVLWYGDPDNYDAPHPFSRWYPLFPRKGNGPIGGDPV